MAGYVISYENIAAVLCENREVPEMKCNGKSYLSGMLAREQGRDHQYPFESPIV
jgi:hypothetical protein